MKKTILQNISLALILGVTIFSLTNCSKDENNEIKATKLEFKSSGDAALSVDNQKHDDLVVNFVTDAPLNEIKIEKVLAQNETQDWCTAKLKNASEISIMVGASDTYEERVATFKISAADLNPITFTVTQAPQDEPAETTLSVDLTPGKDGYYYFMADGKNPQPLSVVVTTNAKQWNATLDNMYSDEEITYCKLTKKSGKSGEAAIITFTGDNTTGMMNSGALLKITVGNDDNKKEISINVNQNLPPATFLDVYDADWNNQLETNYTVNFTSGAMGASKRQSFGQDTDGALTFVICEPGQSTPSDATWLYAGQGGDIIIYPISANTGAARSLDVVILGDENKEFFRFKVTQAAGN